jgi:predicted MFS family arabinose efflux permease
MGQLAYLAVLCSERWGAGPGLVSMVWGVSGLSFFLGNWCGGRFLRSPMLRS